MKKVHRAMAEDDELRAKLDCRRSSRLSPSLPSHFSDWGADKEGGMPSIEEEEVSGGECSAEEDIPELLQASSSSIGDPELHSPSCLVSDSMPKPTAEVEEGPLAFPLPEALEEGRALGSLSVSASRSSSTVSVLHSAHSDGQKLGEVLDSVLAEGDLEADGVISILSPM
ncbi:hypothetical protein Dimus_022231 [Dionaea muscipula]